MTEEKKKIECCMCGLEDAVTWVAGKKFCAECAGNGDRAALLLIWDQLAGIRIALEEIRDGLPE